MYYVPYRLTTWERETVNQEARIVVPEDPEAPAGSVRVVHLMIPDSPSVAIGIDKDPSTIAQNRVYEWPVAPTNQTIKLHLAPQQFISAAALSSMCELSIRIEYLLVGAH